MKIKNAYIAQRLRKCTLRRAGRPRTPPYLHLQVFRSITVDTAQLQPPGPLEARKERRVGGGDVTDFVVKNFYEG
jgi:hypothetical protein